MRFSKLSMRLSPWAWPPAAATIEKVATYHPWRRSRSSPPSRCPRRRPGGPRRGPPSRKSLPWLPYSSSSPSPPKSQSVAGAAVQDVVVVVAVEDVEAAFAVEHVVAAPPRYAVAVVVAPQHAVVIAAVARQVDVCLLRRGAGVVVPVGPHTDVVVGVLAGQAADDGGQLAVTCRRGGRALHREPAPAALASRSSGRERRCRSTGSRGSRRLGRPTPG